ncbi:ankyrin repeat-containing protein, partial [Fusarium sp. NRRL 25303]
MATTQELFRVESASEWAKKNGITTWTKFHYGSQPEQSIFTPLDTWGHSLRQPYYGPIIESSQQYFLVVNWETEEEWDKFKLSPEHQQLMANLTTNNVQPETKIVIFTGNMFAIGFTSNVEIFTAYWPSSITHEAQTAIRKTEQLVHRAESGMPNPLCYYKKPMFGWTDGQREWNGESAIASVWTHKWQNQELEQKYKTTEKRRVSDNDGRSYMLAVDVLQDDLKSLGAIGWESVHAQIRSRAWAEGHLASTVFTRPDGEVSTAGTLTETGFQLSKTKLNPNEQSSVGSPDSETDSTRFTSTTLPSINSPEPSQLSTGSTVIKSDIPEPALPLAGIDASITGLDTSSDDTSRAEASSTIPAGLGTTRAENSEETNPATETFVPEPSGVSTTSTEQSSGSANLSTDNLTTTPVTSDIGSPASTPNSNGPNISTISPSTEHNTSSRVETSGPKSDTNAATGSGTTNTDPLLLPSSIPETQVIGVTSAISVKSTTPLGEHSTRGDDAPSTDPGHITTSDGDNEQPSSTSTYFVVPVTTSATKPEPRDDGFVVPCNMWFFNACVGPISGWGISLPPGTYPPGPPPAISDNPKGGIEINTNQPLPDWPGFTVGPGNAPTFSSEPTACETDSAELCVTSTSYGLDLDSMFGTTTKRATTTIGDASEPTETVWTGTCPAKNGPDPTVVDGEFTENIGEKCLCKWNTWMENDKTLQPYTVDQLRDAINDFCNSSRKLRKPTPTGLPDIAVNRFPTNGTHGIFISVGWATPPLWNSTDERCKVNSDLLLADSCKAALEKFECRGANTDELWGGTYYEALEEGGYHNRATVSGPLFHLALHHVWMDIVKLAISADENLLKWIDPNSGNTALHIAIEGDRVDVIKTLLDAGADTNLKNRDGLLPFAKAMRSNYLDIVRTLLDFSPDIIVDDPDKEGVTPFLRACLDGKKAVPVIRELLDKVKDKVNLNARLPRDDQKNECGRTALIIAPCINLEKEGSDSLFNLLLEHGADPNVPCAKHGNTPLSKAAAKGHVQAIEKLLEFNADPNIASEHGHTPLSRGAMNGHALAVRKLLESNADPNHQDHEGETALHSCSSKGHVSCIEELVTRGASLNSLMYPDVGEPYLIGFTPLVLAIACSQQSSVEKLLTFDPGPGQALHMALASEEFPIAKAVFKRYPQPNLYDQDLGTPLHLAVMSNSEEIFDFILDQKGIDVNIPGPSGRTPLSYAAMRYQGFVKKLIQAQADPNIKDHEDKTPLDHVIAAKDWKMAQILCPHTRLDLVQGIGRRHSVLYRACQTGHKDMFKVINASCQNLSHFQYIELCELALHAAIAAGKEEFFNQLINVPGVTGSVEDDDGWTPLKYATVYNQSKMKEEILERLQQDGMNGVEQRDQRVTKMPQRWHKNDRHPTLYEKDDNADPREIMITTTLDDAYPDGEDRYAVGRADHPIPTDENYYFEITVKKGCPDEQLDVGIGLIDGAKVPNGQRSLGRALTYCYESLGGSTREYREGNTVGCGFDATKKCVYFTWEGERL